MIPDDGAGNVASTTVYARLTSSASNGASGNIVLTSPGTISVNVATGSGQTSLPTVNAGSDVGYSVGGTISFDATVTGAVGSGQTLISYDFESSANGCTSGGEVSGCSWLITNSLGNFETGNSGYAFTITPHNNYGSSDGAYLALPVLDMSSWTQYDFFFKNSL